MKGKRMSRISGWQYSKVAGAAAVFFGSVLAVSAAMTNLALQKGVKFSETPNYALSKDVDDVRQLTDGIFAPRMWADKQAVTWSAKQGVAITVDLGQVEPIEKVRFSTAAREASDVHWPAELCVFISSDGKTWSYMGDIIEENRANGKMPAEPVGEALVSHRFVSQPIRQPARFVTIVGRATGKILTCDEIQVIRADSVEPALANTPVRQGERAWEIMFKEYLIIKGIKARLAADRSALKSLIASSSLSEEQRGGLLKQVDDIPPTSYSFGEIDPEEFRTIFPLNEEHRKLFEVQAQFWRLLNTKPVHIAAAWRYGWLPHFHLPLPSVERLDIQLLGNEHRSGMLLISNAGSEPMTFRLGVKWKGEAWVSHVPYVSKWTDTREGVAVADALVPLTDGTQFTVPSGMTTKLWLAFDSHGSPPGEHEGVITLSGTKFSKEIPLKVKISPVELEHHPLAIGLWDYVLSAPHYAVTDENKAQALKFLQENGVNVAWIASSDLPIPKEINDRTLGKLEKDFDALAGRVKADWGNADYYLAFLNAQTSFAGHPVGSAEFQKKLTLWLRAMAKAFDQVGVPSNRIFLLTVDEPSKKEKAVLSAQWARAISAAGTKIGSFTDPVWKPPFQSHEYMELADIVSPNMQTLHHSGEEALRYFEGLRSNGSKLWFYVCSGPVRLSDPVAYYRLPSWFAFRHQGSGLGFWAFGDTGGGSSWNEYCTGKTSFSPVFIGAKEITTSIHWEALREGKLDFSYFHMLEKGSEVHPQFKGVVNLLREQITEHLKRTPRNTHGDRLVSGLWQDEPDTGWADEIRIWTIALLEAMQSPEKVSEMENSEK